MTFHLILVVCSHYRLTAKYAHYRLSPQMPISSADVWTSCSTVYLWNH